MNNNKMKKQLLIVILALLLVVPMVSAWDWDNIKTYDRNSNTIIVTNALGLGETLVRMQLMTPQDYKVIDAGEGVYQKVAEIKLHEFKSDLDGAFAGTKTYDVLKDFKEEGRDIKLKYRVTISEGEIPIYGGNNCNATYCIPEIIGYEKIETYDWIEFTELSELPKQNTFIGIFADVKPGDKVEWIPDRWFGERIEEWATWTEALNENLIGYWNCEAHSNTTLVEDVVTGTYNGTLATNGAAIGTGTGIIGDSCDSDGTGAGIEDGIRFLADTNLLNGTFSIQTWYYADAWTDNAKAHFVFKAGSYRPGVAAGQKTPGDLTNVFFHDDDEAFNELNIAGFNTGQWYHLVLTVNNTDQRVYINGGLNTTNQQGAGPDYTAQDRFVMNSQAYDGRTDS